jgi:putative hydrolase of HD superfamily
MTDKPDIHRLLEFQRLLQQFQAIERVNHTIQPRRQENDTEHSYNLAMTAWYLAGHFPDLDRDEVIRFALVLDLVEVHAGDTSIYGDQASIDSKQARETKALEQLENELENDWKDFPDMAATIHAYEQRSSEESKFVYALDKIMPIMLIYLGDGYTWQQEGIPHERLHEAKRHKVAVSEGINDYYRQLHDLLLTSPHLFPKQ